MKGMVLSLKKLLGFAIVFALLCSVSACAVSPPKSETPSPAESETPPIAEPREDADETTVPLFDGDMFAHYAELLAEHPDIGALLVLEPTRFGREGEDFYLEFDTAASGGRFADAEAMRVAAASAMAGNGIISFVNFHADGDTLTVAFVEHPREGAIAATGYDGPTFNTEHLEFIAEAFAEVPNFGEIFREPLTSFEYRVSDKTLTLCYDVFYPLDCEKAYMKTMERLGYVTDSDDLYLERGSIKSGLVFTVYHDRIVETARVIWRYVG